MKKTILLLLIILCSYSLMNKLNAQSTWQNASDLVADSNNNPIKSSSTGFWYKFINNA